MYMIITKKSTYKDKECPSESYAFPTRKLVFLYDGLKNTCKQRSHFESRLQRHRSLINGIRN